MLPMRVSAPSAAGVGDELCGWWRVGSRCGRHGRATGAGGYSGHYDRSVDVVFSMATGRTAAETGTGKRTGSEDERPVDTTTDDAALLGNVVTALPHDSSASVASCGLCGVFQLCTHNG